MLLSHLLCYSTSTRKAAFPPYHSSHDGCRVTTHGQNQRQKSSGTHSERGSVWRLLWKTSGQPYPAFWRHPLVYALVHTCCKAQPCCSRHIAICMGTNLHMGLRATHTISTRPNIATPNLTHPHAGLLASHARAAPHYWTPVSRNIQHAQLQDMRSSINGLLEDGDVTTALRYIYPLCPTMLQPNCLESKGGGPSSIKWHPTMGKGKNVSMALRGCGGLCLCSGKRQSKA